MSAPWELDDWWQLSPSAALDALDQAAVAEIHRTIGYLHDGTPRACTHTDTEVWFVCGWHPAQGLVCEGCLRLHLTARHPHDLEHRCDSCGGQGTTMVPLILKVPRPRWVRPPRAAKTRNATPVLLAGLGFCERCAARLGFPVGRAA